MFVECLVCQLIRELTRPAGDLGLLPLAAWQTPDHRVQFLHESLKAIIAQLGVGLVALPLLPKQLGIGDSRRWAARRCVMENQKYIYFFFNISDENRESVDFCLGIT